MALEPFSPENTTIFMVDYSVGFLNSFRSHTIGDHLTATVALARTAIGFKTGFVVNLGAGQKPYPQLLEAIGDHEVIYRGGEYNALENPDVRKAIEATGRPRIAIGGISTDGCVIETALGALRLGYEVALVADATAGETRETHDLAVQRMVQAGVVPTSWLSLATELQYDWQRQDTAQAYFALIAEASPGVMASVQAEHATAQRPTDMAHFLVQFSYTSGSLRGLVDQPDLDHASEASAMVASLGGALIGYWYCFGRFDGVVLLEAPEPAVAAAVAMAIGGSGEVRRLETTVLLSMEEAKNAARQAAGAAHLPPGGQKEEK